MEIAIHKAGMSEKECVTKNLQIHGYKENNNYNALYIIMGLMKTTFMT